MVDEFFGVKFCEPEEAVAELQRTHDFLYGLVCERVIHKLLEGGEVFYTQTGIDYISVIDKDLNVVNQYHGDKRFRQAASLLIMKYEEMLESRKLAAIRKGEDA